MRVIFAGTPEVAVPALHALLHSAHTVVAVYTQPDRPAGRGKKLTLSPIKKLALQHPIPIEQPQDFTALDTLETLRGYRAEVMIVMAYGLLLPRAVLTLPTYGCINIHVSLLPRWRGATPVQQALLAGDQETGVTLIQMDKGLDTGPILAQQACSILATDTSESLFLRLNTLIPELLLKTLTQVALHTVQPLTQHHAQATYAPKIEKQQAHIDWHESSEMIERKVRAYYPVPIAFFEWQQRRLRVWEGHSTPTSSQQPPGSVLAFNAQGLVMKTADGAYTMTRLQVPGKNPLCAADLWHAYHNKWLPL